MIAPDENIDILLPFGEALRSFVEQPFISKLDLKAALRSRGVFVYSSSKEDTIPIALCCLLSAREFDQLKECQNTREDNLKQFTRLLDWKSPQKLLESVPSNLDVSKLLGEGFGYCKVLGSPTFVPIANNPDKIRLAFELERKDISKSWATTKSRFKGGITLEKIYDGKHVKLLFTYTANETKFLNQALTKRLKQHFKEKKYIEDTSDVRILFTDFTNEQRVAFFLNLTGANSTKTLEFKDVPDMGVCPDQKAGNLPPEMEWMQKKVADLKVKGESLHETIFIKDSRFHKYLLLYSMDVGYTFSYHAAAGKCLISFEFVGFTIDNPSAGEFEITITSLNPNPTYEHLNKSSIKEYLLSVAESMVLDQIQKVKPPVSNTQHL